MKHASIFAVAIVSGLVATAGRAQEAKSGPSPDVPDLAALSGLIGNWDCRFQSKENGAAARTGTATGAWIHGGRYFRQVWTIDAAGAEPGLSGSSIMTYDPAKKTYRSWHFVSTGSTSEGVGAYDKATKTMTWTARDPNGFRTSTKSTPSGDAEDWTITVTDTDGRVVSDMSGKNIRRKK